MSDSVQSQRRQPTRLRHPLDSPGKNTGVGCHFLLQCMKVKSESEVAQLCPTLCDPIDCSTPGLPAAATAAAKSLQSCLTVQSQRRQPTRLSCLWDFPGKNTGVGCHFLLQCIKVKSESEVALSCPTLSDPMDCSLPGFSIHGIFQARVLEWGAIAFSLALTRWTFVDKAMCLLFNMLSRLVHGTPLQYSCLENPMDGRPWWAAVHGVAKSRTRLSDFTFTFHFYALEKEMATHSSVLAWRIPGTEEPGGLLSMGSKDRKSVV